jgi:hypothetical protein
VYKEEIDFFRLSLLKEDKKFKKKMNFIYCNWMLLFGLAFLIYNLNAFSVENSHQRRYRREETTKASAPFTCPGDGKWPDETDCGK